MRIQNAEQAKSAGLSFKEAKHLINDFNMFHPEHILPADRAKRYLDESWEGRALDIKHFGFEERPRRKRSDAKKDSSAAQGKRRSSKMPQEHESSSQGAGGEGSRGNRQP